MGHELLILTIVFLLAAAGVTALACWQFGRMEGRWEKSDEQSAQIGAKSEPKPGQLDPELRRLEAHVGRLEREVLRLEGRMLRLERRIASNDPLSRPFAANNA
ncbi:MAG: hypothetical protein OXI55_14870 [Gammaproteobacteria bacterium]|nr:hypothetical protein [Gammaproteobacteria bacterium]